MRVREDGKVTAACLSVALCACVLGGCGFSGSSEPTSESRLRLEFKREFGIDPSGRTTNILCKTVTIGDTWGKWFRFDYDPEFLEQILAQGFSSQLYNTNSEVIIPEDLWAQDVSFANPNAPSWWTSPSIGTLVYYRRAYIKNYSGSFAYMWVVKETKTVYYCMSAWD